MNDLKTITLPSEGIKVNLPALLNTSTSPLMYGFYGGGKHCDNPEKNKSKLDLWGLRGDKEKESESLCEVAKGYEIGGKVIGFLNTGIIKEQIINVTQEFLSKCTDEEGANYTKAFATFSPDNRLNHELFKGIGVQEIDCKNNTDILSMHSDRFYEREVDNAPWIQKKVMVIDMGTHQITCNIN